MKTISVNLTQSQIDKLQDISNKTERTRCFIVRKAIQNVFESAELRNGIISRKTKWGEETKGTFKSSILLEDEQFLKLEKLSDGIGKSKISIIRFAIDAFLRKYSAKEEKQVNYPIAEARGL